MVHRQLSAGTSYGGTGKGERGTVEIGTSVELADRRLTRYCSASGSVR